MVYENAKIEVILADEEITMDLKVSVEGDGDNEGSLDWWD